MKLKRTKTKEEQLRKGCSQERKKQQVIADLTALRLHDNNRYIYSYMDAEEQREGGS